MFIDFGTEIRTLSSVSPWGDGVEGGDGLHGGLLSPTNVTESSSASKLPEGGGRRKHSSSGAFLDASKGFRTERKLTYFWTVKKR